MDTIEVERQAGSDEGPEASGGTTQRAREVVSDVADAARSAVETTAPAVLEAGRSTAGNAYAQVRRAPDEQLAMATAFAAGLVTGFILARVPRALLVLALIPLAVFGGTLLGRKVPFIGRAMGSRD